MNKCHYKKDEESCVRNCKYGNYCSKHRRYYLLEDDKYICIENFTNKETDYLKKDLINYAEKKLNMNCKGVKKSEIFKNIKQHRKIKVLCYI